MKCLVPIKRVVDPYISVRVKFDHSDVDIQNVKKAMNPFDEIAIEEAVRLKEKGLISEIIAVSIGQTIVQETLRQALARGADSAKLIECNDKLNPLDVAKILQKISLQETPDLIFMGKQAIDGDHNQTGQMLAGLLNWGQATFASKVTLDKDNKILEVVREIDGGLETLKLQLPAVVTTDLRLNEPRYISLPNVMQAKRKPLTITPLSDLQVERSLEIKSIKVEEFNKVRKSIKIENTSDLVSILKTKEQVI